MFFSKQAVSKEKNSNMYIIFFILDAKLQNNAELEKHFWRNHAVCPINKGNSGKNEESLKVGTKQNYAVR